MLTQIFALCLFSVVLGQQAGTLQAENHPPLTVQQCTVSGGCSSMTKSIVLDGNWRWTHKVGDATNCYTGDEWDKSLCPDPVTCAQNCAIDGVDYQGTYGITTSGGTLNLKFVTHGQYGTNVGSRVYLLDDDSTYLMLKLKNKEFTFDVDVSNLPCGLNGALYLVAMSADGGMSYSGNKAGAKFGTGYCDAQCPHDIKFINGEANILDWKPSPNNPNAGIGMYGTCCIEMDVWESNQVATAYTPHVCTVQGQYRCNGTECGDGSNRYGGVCDKDGCDFNSYREGNRTFIGQGSGFIIDTTKPFTVVTQYITNDGTDRGTLSDIKRLYVQGGRVIENSAVNFPGIKPYTSVSDQFCTDIKQLFGDKNDFEAKGGLRAMSQALDRGMVLVLSLWDDYEAYMLWLDSDYPVDQPPSKPGVARGPCSTDSGRPKDVESKYPNSDVKYMNVRWGEIGSTYKN